MPFVEREPEIEIDGPPRFHPGDKVIARLNVKNDGTFPGRDIGERLVHKGDVGYVRDIGTFLQQFYIYAVEWVDRGVLVGMRARELGALDALERTERSAP
ncbi:nitrogen fixation protein NifZ [Pleomorphomonas sp. JP5]|uniref:nitrogen fixation protein NifZ n=1 Tax=Pleomorphomonas sp. JP5 TaxID=2942998 RepID=UPI002042F877|nr:nitrogen fixation protein NifZ [Pleomorphomonas sp. JP5]MCM5558227.1 nitrogen fixation protein NifZ [Pleomorphomonas sp. JP5]